MEQLLSLNSTTIFYVSKETLLSGLPPGLRAAINQFTCQSPVLVFCSENGAFVSAEPHCHCLRSPVHPLLCLAWQTYITKFCMDLF